MFILIKRIFLTSVFILGCAGAQASKHTGTAEDLSFDSPVKVSSNKYPIKISSVALESVVDDFKAFRTVSQQRRDSLEFLQLLSGFSKENDISIQFSMICDQIVSQNLLKVSSLSEVSKLLSVKTEKTITEKENGDYIKVSNKK